MTIAHTFALLAALATHAASSAQGSPLASLAVSATVIRPAEVSIIIRRGQVEAVTIASAAEPEVLADRGIVTRLDGRTTVVPQPGADSLVVTVVY